MTFVLQITIENAASSDDLFDLIVEIVDEHTFRFYAHPSIQVSFVDDHARLTVQGPEDFVHAVAFEVALRCAKCWTTVAP